MILKVLDTGDLIFLIKQYKLDNIHFLRDIIFKTSLKGINYYVVKYSNDSYHLFNLESSFNINTENDGVFKYSNTSLYPDRVFITDDVLGLLIHLSKYKNLIKEDFAILSSFNISDNFLNKAKGNMPSKIPFLTYFKDSRFKEIFTLRAIFYFNKKQLDLFYDGIQYIVKSGGVSHKYKSINYTKIRNDFHCKKIIKTLY